jgi:hypothetical protein
MGAKAKNSNQIFLPDALNKLYSSESQEVFVRYIITRNCALESDARRKYTLVLVVWG